MSTSPVIPVTATLKIEALVQAIISSSHPELILEVAPEATLFDNEINLRTLKFYAEEADKRLIIQTSDFDLIERVRRLGLLANTPAESMPPGTTAPSVSEYGSYRPIEQRDETPVNQTIMPPAALTSGNLWRLALASLGTLIVLTTAVWWFWHPRAVVLVYPKEERSTFEANVVISPKFNDQQISRNKLPAKLLQKSGEALAQINTTGRRLVGITAAVGRVTFLNSGEQPISIPRGTIISGTDKIRFSTDNELQIPRATPRIESGIRVGTNWGRAEVGVTALVKGSSGNLPAKVLTKLEAKNYPALQLFNLAPVTGGSDKMAAVVAEDDLKRAENEARQQMQLNGPEELHGLAGQDYLLIPELVRLEELRVTPEAAVGSEASLLRTKLDYQVSALAPSQVGLKKFLRYQLDQNTPPGFQARSDQLRLLNLKVLNRQIEQAELALQGQGLIQGVLNRSRIRRLIAGKELAAAKEALNAEDGIGEFRITIKGEGERLPGWGFQIKVVFPAGSRPN